MVRAVFFDVGNTLLFPYPSVAEVCREVFADAGHDRERTDIEGLMPLVDEYYEDAYGRDDTFWADENRTAEVWIGMYSLLARKLGIQDEAVAAALADRIYREFGNPARWMPYADVASAFERLRARGVGIGIISNWDSRLESILAELGLGRMIDVVVSSAAVGLHKPDPRIFEHACEALGVLPHEAVHVGDHHYADIIGASAAGLRPVLIDRHGIDRHGSALATLDLLEYSLGWVDVPAELPV
ncbi:MAG: HAD-IA family hydrolase [Clostridiales bacterium]|nr:HAD-IA family hydrolase [Clostridiales bacterium]